MSLNVRQNNRKSLVGTVVSKSGDKTVKVAFYYKVPHPLYRKEIKRKTVLHAHDVDNKCHIGDVVSVLSTRPLSKLKRWRVAAIITSAASGASVELKES